MCDPKRTAKKLTTPRIALVMFIISFVGVVCGLWSSTPIWDDEPPNFSEHIHASVAHAAICTDLHGSLKCLLTAGSIVEATARARGREKEQERERERGRERERERDRTPYTRAELWVCTLQGHH